MYSSFIRIVSLSANGGHGTSERLDNHGLLGTGAAFGVTRGGGADARGASGSIGLVVDGSICADSTRCRFGEGQPGSLLRDAAPHSL